MMMMVMMVMSSLRWARPAIIKTKHTSYTHAHTHTHTYTQVKVAARAAGIVKRITVKEGQVIKVLSLVGPACG